MNLVQSEPGFVLHERPYRETSALLEVLTRDHGRIGVVVRGLRAIKPRIQRGSVRAFQCLSLDLRLVGDLGQLISVETLGHPLHLQGESLRAGLYINELIARMTERHDPHPEIFARYAQLLTELGAVDALAWTLRRFERDLLALLGYGLLLTHVFDEGSALDPDRSYQYLPEQGPRALTNPRAMPQCKGSALLALAEDEMPTKEDLASLRLLMRALIRHHLGGRELDAWRVLSSYRAKPPETAQD